MFMATTFYSKLLVKGTLTVDPAAWFVSTVALTGVAQLVGHHPTK